MQKTTDHPCCLPQWLLGRRTRDLRARQTTQYPGVVRRVVGRVVIGIGRCLREGSLGEEMLRDLLLNEDMVRAVRQGDHAKFIELRLAKIASIEELFYKPHLEALGLDAKLPV